MNSETVKERILRDTGALEKGSLRTLRRIREWVYQHTVVSATPGTLLPDELLQGDLASLFGKQENLEGGVLVRRNGNDVAAGL